MRELHPHPDPLPGGERWADPHPDPLPGGERGADPHPDSLPGGERESPPSPRRRRARRGSFYTAHFNDGELIDLEALKEKSAAGNLAGEIAMLRVVSRRLLSLAQGVETLDEMIAVVNSLGLSAARLANLLRAQKQLTGGDEARVTAALSQALHEVVQELGGK